MWIVYCIIWFALGSLGCYIYNKNIKYEEPWLKYLWNVLVFSMGLFGLECAILTWLGIKLDKKK